MINNISLVDNEFQFLKSVLTKLDTLIANKKITVSSINPPDCFCSSELALTNRSDSIILNFDKIFTDCLEKDITENQTEILLYSLIKGFNIHELSHVLFTKYNTNRLNALHIDVLNWLEDCRIENNIIKKYPIVDKYLKSCLDRYILKDIIDNIKTYETDTETNINFCQNIQQIINLIIRIFGTDQFKDDEYKPIKDILTNQFLIYYNQKTLTEFLKLIHEYINTKDDECKKQILIAKNILNLLSINDNEDKKINPKVNPKGNSKTTIDETKEELGKYINKINDKNKTKIINDKSLINEIKTIKENMLINDDIKNNIKIISHELKRIKTQSDKTDVLRQQKKGRIIINDVIKKFSDLLTDK